MTSKQLTGLYDRLTDTYDYRPLLKQIKESQETHIVLDCEFDRIESILVQAREIELLTDYHNYLVTSLDMDKIYMEQFKDTVSFPHQGLFTSITSLPLEANRICKGLTQSSLAFQCSSARKLC